MPELPDIENYIGALDRHVVGHRVTNVRLKSVFLVRSVRPPTSALAGCTLDHVTRLGKRLVFRFAGDPGRLFMVLHLMVAGRLHWKELGIGLPGKRGLLAVDFDHGTLLLTEAGRKKRASVFLEESGTGVSRHDPGGAEVHEADYETFARVLSSENHTLKRALTDPTLLSGIGGAYADEIMHHARVSPVKWTSRLSEDEKLRLYQACRSVLDLWTRRIGEETGDGWPAVTAFREGMAVHGRFGEPCPECGSPVQRIVHSTNETDYCAVCQTDGKILADRSLSRLLRDDWPRGIEDLEERAIRRHTGPD